MFSCGTGEGCLIQLMAENFKLWSDDLTNPMGKIHVFDDFGAGGENESPHLAWSGAPEGTKSFLVTCYDPDAPTVSGWWHWCVANIPASVTSLEAGISAYPEGSVIGLNDYNQTGYGGACPPPGDPAHAYVFTVYALGTEAMDVTPGTQPAMIMFMANEHILGKASLVSYYGR